MSSSIRGLAGSESEDLLVQPVGGQADLVQGPADGGRQSRGGAQVDVPSIDVGYQPAQVGLGHAACITVQTP